MFYPFGHIWNTNTLKLIAELRKKDGKRLLSSLSESPHFSHRCIWAEIRIRSDYWQKPIGLFKKMDAESGFALLLKEKMCLFYKFKQSFVTCKGTLLSSYKACCQSLVGKDRILSITSFTTMLLWRQAVASCLSRLSGTQKRYPQASTT